jgi:hypothetical protein
MPKTPASNRTRSTKRTKRATIAAGALTAAFAVAVAPSHAQSTSGVSADAQAQSQATTQKDRTDLSLTVYNAGIALVRDVRNVQLGSGIVPLRFEDVSASINPVTVHFRSLTEASKVNVIEQNYEYDLLDPDKLLKKYVGREVTLVRGEEDASSTRWVETKALLLSDNTAPVWKIGNEIVTGMPTDHYKFPDLPGNLYTQPTLIWTLDNRGAAAQKIEAAYITNGINWSADYVLTVARDEKSADLNGWVTLVNNSGVAYENAKLQLVAGKIHQAEDARAMRKVTVSAAMAMEAKPAPQFEQENFNEYHLYTLGRETSVENNESKQISLLSGTDIPVEKYLLVESDRYYFRNPQGIGNAVAQPVKVFYRFKNDKAHSLGMPLPAGTVRVYQADSKGGTQFVGEDNIEHTPKDENVRIYTGEAFDVVCERRELDYKKIASNQYEMQLQISLRNHKDTPVTVEVREPIGGDWEILDSNFKWTKLDSGTVGFSIPVEKDGSATLTYRVRVKW